MSAQCLFNIHFVIAVLCYLVSRKGAKFFKMVVMGNNVEPFINLLKIFAPLRETNQPMIAHL